MLSLGVRTFLLSFVPLCLALGVSFFVIHAAIRARIKEGLRESIHRTEAVLDQVNVQHKSRTRRLVAVLSEQAELKAGLGLLREVPPGHPSRPQIRRTIEDQLRDLGGLLDYDVLIVADASRRSIAGVAGPNREGVAPDSLGPPLGESPLLTVQGILYEVLTAPINLRGENLGTLTVGSKFDLTSFGLAGEAGLLRNQRIVLTTFPGSLFSQIERQLQSRCPHLDDTCQIEVSGQTYLVTPVVRAEFGPAYQLLSFQSLDAALGRFTHGFASVFFEIGASGVALVLLLSVAAARLISKPLGDLIARVQQSEPTGQLPGDFSTRSSAREVNLVAEALNRAAIAAQAAGRAKGDFLAGMSHELRTPLNGVMGMMEVLLETDLTPEQRECGETIRSSAAAVLNLINDILDYSRLEAGKLSIEAAPFDLGLVVEDVACLMAPVAHKRGLDLIVRYAPGAPRRLIADAGRLRQVLTNLVGNAVKFTHHGHLLINVECERQTRDEARLQLSVEDTGIGIAPDKTEQIFEKFVQADASTTRRYGGTGLGLAICRQLVGLMGGQMGVRSSLGQGSTFWFVVDLPQDPEALDWRAHLPAWDPVKALLVEEYEPSRRVLEEQIASLGLRVESCASGEEAVRRLREARQRGEPFRVLLADCGLFAGDGALLAQALQAEPLRDTALVALTSLDGMDQARRITAAASTHYLFRPVRLGQLLEVLGSVLAAPGTSAPSPDHRRPQAPLPAVAAQVLLAEDNEVNQRIAVKMLERLGSRVDVAASGKEALEMLERRPYDLVFMDCQMPEMDGYQATAEIRRRHLAGRRLPIIAMTANAMAGDRDRCFAAGMDDYITKPASLQDLRSALERWLPPEHEPEVTAERPAGSPAP